jgi:predicted N-formylglutamate amidohydrolase
MNEPYSPDDRVFHTLDRHAVRRGLAPLMIEIRNDLIGSVEQGREWAERLAPLLQEALGGS